jgi:2-hydroxychromene-2-carboxylate isomerase
VRRCLYRSKHRRRRAGHGHDARGKETGTMSQPDKAAAPGTEIEIWFEFGSNYSYLSVMRIEQAAALASVRVAWQPMLLGAIFRALGFANAPFLLQKEKLAYVQKDMARQCRKYGLPPWTPPTVFPRLGVLPLRIVLVGNGASWTGAFCREVMKLNFVLDQDINDAAPMTKILDALGLPGDDIVAQAQSEPIKARLRAQTEAARERGIFGAPTFFVAGEMFWGDDRLDDALAHASALQATYAKSP